MYIHIDVDLLINTHLDRIYTTLSQKFCSTQRFVRQALRAIIDVRQPRIELSPNWSCRIVFRHLHVAYFCLTFDLLALTIGALRGSKLGPKAIDSERLVSTRLIALCELESTNT